MIITKTETEKIEQWCDEILTRMSNDEINQKNRMNRLGQAITISFNNSIKNAKQPIDSFSCSFALKFIYYKMYSYFLKNRDETSYPYSKKDVKEMTNYLITLHDTKMRQRKYWSCIRDNNTTNADRMMFYYVKKSITEQQDILSPILLKDYTKR